MLTPGEEAEWPSMPYASLPDGATGETTFDGKDLGFAVDANPAACALFEAARIDIDDISAQNALIAAGEDSADDIARHVGAWIAAQRAEYDGWLEAAGAAAA